MTTILKCKMCGGTLEVQENETVARCKYCGSLMTLPKIDNEKKARIFNRANEYRLNNEFDEAYDAYKSIVEEDPTEAEAYWGMILSEYGIEYVEDPRSGKRIPTCHRTQTKPIHSSTNYEMALKYADPERRMLYQDEAKELDKLQRSILAVSSREEPYDVFISYKETDDLTGERTPDSVIAQDIYNELNRAGFKTFFSRITLEKHLGENYEPYIYAALNSAKVLITVSTKPEHLESTWVKNEWMRFLHMMDNDPSKVIIPVYKDMSPYELPYILSGYQSQDMSKIGAIQDLVHGVERILNKQDLSEKDVLLNQLLEKQKQEVEAKKRREEAERKRKVEEAKRIEREKAEREKREKERLEKQKKREEQWRNNKKYVFASIIFVAVCTIASLIFVLVVQPKQKLNKAMSLIDAEKYEEAYSLLEEIDRSDLIAENKLDRAVSLIESENYDEAYILFEQIGDVDAIAQSKLNRAVDLLEKGNYDAAYILFEQIGDVEDISESKYNRAIALIDEGEDEGAYLLLKDINYKDSAEIVKKIIMKRFEEAEVNSTLFFGSFEQNDDSSVKENIEWRVIEKEGNKILLVSKYVLSFLTFDTSGRNVEWDKSFIRKWLNINFLDEAFTSDEQMLIYSRTLSDTNTVDQVFLLSVNEANKYFDSDQDRLAEATKSALAEGAEVNANGNIRWWLRSNGDKGNTIAYVNASGELNESGANILSSYCGVRPAIWIQLSE